MSAPGRLNGNGGDNRPADVQLDQYYTQEEVAEYFYGKLEEYLDLNEFLMIEPSAGMGSFYKLMPADSLAYDVDPKFQDIQVADFLTVRDPSDRPVAVIGNPPFGKNSSMAVRFFNHAATMADAIAMIFPRTFRKASLENRLDRAFHLIFEENVPENAFLFRSKPYNVPAVFQIWVRRPTPRILQRVERKHPDFQFVTAACCDFAIQRVGANAGRVHHDLHRSSRSHYFIKGDVEKAMSQLDFSVVKNNVAGNPSIAMAEIVSLYQKRKQRCRKVAGSCGTP